MQVRSLALALSAALAAVAPARAQSLEETFFTLQFSGRDEGVRREAPGVAVAPNGMEARVVDAAACMLRFTDRNRPAFNESRQGWDGPVVKERNDNSLYEEVYLGRVIPQDVKKAPDVLGTRNGVVVEQTVDGKWLLPGSPGDEVRCHVFPSHPKACWDHWDVWRIPASMKNSPDQMERTARVDRALVHLYADLCKGAAKRVPF